MFGVSIPVPLEIGEDSKFTVNVTSFGHVHRRVDFAIGAINETDVTASNPLAPSDGGFAGPGVATYYAESNSTNPAGCTFHVVFHGTGTDLTVVSTSPNNWALRALISGTHDDTSSCGGLTLSFPFSFVATLANGRSILRNGVLKGIDFTQDFTTATGKFLSTGRLKVGN